MNLSELTNKIYAEGVEKGNQEAQRILDEANAKAAQIVANAEKQAADKVAKAGFTITPSPNVDAPIINEYKLTLECRVVTFDEDENGGARVVGEVVNMSADESILDAEGNIDLGKLQPVVFDSSNNTYRVVGEKVGDAWGAGKRIQEKQVN